MEFLNSFLSLVLHIAFTAFLVVYLPLSLVWRLAAWLFVRPFTKEDLKGKAVLITGASSGIGEQLAYEYAKRGASIALVARRQHALNNVADEARKRGASDVLVLPADISKPEDAKRVVDETVARFGKLNHLVANAGIWCCCFFEEITNITAFTEIMDVNFWGAVYPTYYALPHLKASRGKIIANTSVAGRVPTANMSFYNASKAATIRFYETLRSEFGSAIHITILLPGYVESELTKGKALQKGGTIEINENARDVQIGPFPIGRTQTLATVAVDGACRGDKYVTWPSWYKPFHMIMCVAPEIINWFSHSFYVAKEGDPSSSLSKKVLVATGAKDFLYPPSLRSNNIKMEKNGGML
ncbi:11-beta-hydroxysteroid dehydrogenase A-like [Typha latifolia]|uniref:11-beta-hydroxysteroid dehydrogenase A-like n=1 Tax=Typha latifolia TaxID=4733 RepID=UPI003C3089CF